MNRHEFNKLHNIVMKTAKAVYDNEKFPVGFLAARARRIAQQFPHDPTSVGFSGFLSKRASSNGSLFITRAELKDVYSKLYYPNNKLAQHFTNELGIVEETHTTVMHRDPKEGLPLVENAYKELADPLLSEQLGAALDNKSFNAYSNSVAVDAKKACARELNSCGVLPKTIDVVAGQSDLLICQATYETPKGHSHVLIPVEIKNSRALIPSVFLATSGFVDINSQCLKDHLTSTAGKKYEVNAKQLLDTISNAKTGALEPMNDVEFIVMKTATQKGTPSSHTVNNILYQEVDPKSVNVDIKPTSEVQKFAEKLASDVGVAEFTFGKKLIELGRGFIKQELNSAGHKSAQVLVSKADSDTIYYAVAVDGRFGFNVPVKVANGKLNPPKVIVASGSIFEFSPDGINDLLVSAETDPVAMSKASDFYGMKPSALVGQVRQAVSAKNFQKAEEVLHVLKMSGDAVAYQTGYAAYYDGLKGGGSLKKEASSTCSAPTKTANSKYTLCSHTGLPLHKVYQDDNGDCHPSYRKQMSDSSEGGASFLHSRIYFE